MTHPSVVHPLVRARQAMRERMASRSDDSAGFTLMELVVVVAILPIVLGGIAVALVSVFSLQNSVSNRVSDSNDALIASSVFNRDAQSAQMLTTDPNPADPAVPACGTATQTQVLGLEWGASSAFVGGYQTVVSYVQTKVPNAQNTATVYALERQVCSSGASSAYTSQQISSDIGSPSVSFLPASAATNALTQWIPTLKLTSIILNVNEPGANYSQAGGSNPNATDNYKFSLVGLPGESTSNGTPSDPSQDTSGQCSFASPGTGTYANQLCFVDFSDLASGSKTPAVANAAYCGSSTPLFMKMGITDTADTLEFCVTLSGASVAPHNIPTYYAAGGIGTSEAFLGNNGFYTGVSGDPALYQTQGGTTTATFSNIQVLDSSGQPASGWTMVTGDAETTDPGEWMDFTSNLNWSILPNNGASDLWGNACYDSADSSNPYSGVWAWTGSAAPTNAPAAAHKAALTINTTNGFTTGVKSILCESDTPLNKTGTLMVQAQEPQGSTAAQSITVTMYGSGLEALFLAVLL
jgi:prepilin-type N-terminal cleavage/methylation domain-containing protein